MNESNVKISPTITLNDIFGPNLILNPRAPYEKYRWLSEDSSWLDFATGSSLTIAGDMPVICNSSVVSADSLALLKKAEIEIAPFRHVYQTKKDYYKLTNSICLGNKKLVFNYLHPPKAINRQLYWIRPELLAFLNNKANLDKLVPADYLPKREVIGSDEIARVAEKLKLPLVIKVATALPNGGGYGVVICNSVKDLEHAQNYFRTCKKVILEEYIDVSRNYCIQFAKTYYGRIMYLGASQQITGSSGHYEGNWLEKGHEPPKALLELGYSIMENACQLGYYGVAGFDTVISKQNQVFAIDLNFRLNGSTPALLLSKNILKHYDASVLLYRSWKTTINWDKFLSICKNAIEERILIPLSVSNPLYNPHPDAKCIFSGILVGSSQTDVLSNERILTNKISPTGLPGYANHK